MYGTAGGKENLGDVWTAAGREKNVERRLDFWTGKPVEVFGPLVVVVKP